MKQQLIVRPGQTERTAGYGVDSVAELVVTLLPDRTWMPLFVDGNVVLGQRPGFDIDHVAVGILHAAGLETQWTKAEVVAVRGLERREQPSL